MNPQDFDILLQRYLKDQCTDQERKYVESWFDATQKAGKELDFSREENLRNKLWESIEKKLEEQKFRLDYWKVSKIAAAALLIGAVLFSINFYYRKTSAVQSLTALPIGTEMVTVSNTTKIIREILLLDGSKVLLHPGSELKHPVAFSTLRQVYLVGEAFFEVKRDTAHPFLVHTGEVTTRVLGTSFLIQAYKENREIKVAVTSGRVSVFSKPPASFFNSIDRKEEFILTPNQLLVYNKEEKTSTKKLVGDPKMVIPNASKELVFTNEPVTKLFKALEKIYGVTIQYDEKMLTNCMITTEMTDEGLFERLDVICHVLNARYMVNGTTIIIKSTGCSN